MNKPALVLSLAVLAVFAAGPSATAGEDQTLRATYKGIKLMAVPVKPGTKADTTLPGPRAGLQSLSGALDVIYLKSPFSASRLETLKKNGTVMIVYGPNFEEGKTGAFAMAAFFPDFFKKGAAGDDSKTFLVVVGPHAVKWPEDELAMIIVHELVGHGMQHLRGRLEYIRELDLECTANLYGERFYQDIEIDKKSKDVVEFRRGLEDRWCSDFKRYMARRDPSLAKLWDVLDPDVPRLLELFDEYVDEQRARGTSTKAIAAARKMQEEKSRAWVARIEAGGEPEEFYKLGQAFRGGIGVPKDAGEAAKWLRRAADRGVAGAQFSLGEMYLNGEGVARDLVQAHLWLSLSAALYPPGKARDSVAKARDAVGEKLTPEQREYVRIQAKKWWDANKR